MGQPITVVEKQSSNPALVRFETNRPLSGMAHERYTAPPSDLLDRPVDELARRLFAAGGVESVHINSNVVTVGLSGGRTGTGLADVVRSLFRHYPDQPAAAGAPAAPAESPEGADAAEVAEATTEAQTPTEPAPTEGDQERPQAEPPAEGPADAPAEAPAGAETAEAAAGAETAEDEDPGEAGFGRDADGEAQPEEPPASDQVVPDPEPAADAGASTEEPPSPG
jgi:hypothetical protein